MEFSVRLRSSCSFLLLHPPSAFNLLSLWSGPLWSLYLSIDLTLSPPQSQLRAHLVLMVLHWIPFWKSICTLPSVLQKFFCFFFIFFIHIQWSEEQALSGTLWQPFLGDFNDVPPLPVSGAVAQNMALSLTGLCLLHLQAFFISLLEHTWLVWMASTSTACESPADLPGKVLYSCLGQWYLMLWVEGSDLWGIWLSRASPAIRAICLSNALLHFS